LPSPLQILGEGLLLQGPAVPNGNTM
jgi:hypothetical protein